MAKGITINLPQYASVLGMMEEAGFQVSVIAQYVFDEFRGKASHDIPNALIQEFEDITMNFIENPTRTAINAGMGYLKPYLAFLGLGYVLGALGIKKSVRVGKITIKIAK